MTDQEYLEGVLKEQSLSDDSPEMNELRRRRSEVEERSGSAFLYSKTGRDQWISEQGHAASASGSGKK